MVQQSIQHCSDLLHRYRLDRDIRHIFLTGGSTAIPFVKASLERRFALPVDRIDDPAAEALGAAIHGNREPEFFQQLGKTLGNAVDSLSSLLDSLDVKPDVSLMTYREAIDYFVKEIPAQAEKGAMLQQIETRGIIFTQIFLDAHNAPVLRPDGTPFGRRLWIERFDEELRDTFGSNQVVLVE
jgi:molecular chaperone DnaK (HSP70)